VCIELRCIEVDCTIGAATAIEYVRAGPSLEKVITGADPFSRHADARRKRIAISNCKPAPQPLIQ
jgi:hypothetical protein